MSRRWQKGTVLVTLTLLLAALAAPAMDVCACDVPQGERCCQQVVKPLPDTPNCCSSDGQTIAEKTQVPSPWNDAHFAARACQRLLVTSDMVSGDLPSLGKSQKNAGPQAVESVETEQTVIDDSFATRCSLHAPPGGKLPPLFLLNATYRI